VVDESRKNLSDGPDRASAHPPGSPQEPAVPQPPAGEVIDELMHFGRLRVERIVSHGECSPPGFWYDQDEDEWVTLLAGAARLRYEDGGRVVDLVPGDAEFIGAHVRHRVDWTAPDEETVWLAVFSAPA